MSEQPLVSVAMITFNHDRYIADAIVGVLTQQADFPIELIIGEDASTDNTRKIVDRYAQKYPLVLRPMFNDNNIGMMKNYVQTIQRCRGEYVAICEGDDYWTDPLKLRKQVTCMMKNREIAMSFHAVRMKYIDGSRNSWTRRASHKDKIFSDKEVLLGGGQLFQLNSVMIRNDIVKTLPLWFVDAPITDVPLSMLALTKGRIAYINEVMGVHRCDVQDSWSMKHSDFDSLLRYHQGLTVMRKEYDRITRYKYTKWITRRISQNYKMLFACNESTAKKKQIFDQLKSDMSGLDRLYAYFSIIINLSRMRKIIRQGFYNRK